MSFALGFDIRAKGASVDLADNSTAIQATIDAAEAAGGGRVVVPVGIFPYATPLVIDADNVILAGEGRDLSVLEFTGTGAAITFDGSASGLDGVGIESLTIKNGADNTDSTYGLVMDDARFNCYVSKVRVDSFPDRGVYLVDCDNTNLFNVFVEGGGVTDYCFYLENANGIQCFGIETHNPATGTGVGLYADGIDSLGIYGGVFEGGVSASGPGVQIGTCDAGGVVIQSCYFERVSTGIEIDAGSAVNISRDVVILGNKFSGSVTTGIDIDYAKAVLIGYNHIQVATNRIRTTANSSGITIMPNTYSGGSTTDNQVVDTTPVTWAGKPTFFADIPSFALASDTGKVVVKRYSATGRAQFELQTEAGALLWRFGVTSAGGTSYVFYDGTANRLVIDSTGIGVDVISEITSGAGVTVDGWLLKDGAGAPVGKADYDAQTILAATADNTPAAVTVGESEVVGRAAGGNVGALTAAQLRTIIGDAESATRGLVLEAADVGALTDNSGGTSGDGTVAAIAAADMDTTAARRTETRNAIATLAEEINDLRTALRNAGVMA